MKTQETYEAAYEQRAEMYPGLSKDAINEEIAAQYFGVVFSSESNIRQVIENSSQQELSMWQRIVEHLKDFVKRIKDAIERYAVEDKTVRAALKADADTVEELARQFDVCLKEAAKNKKSAEQVQGGEKQSVKISENVPSVEQIEEVRKIGRKSINSFESAEIEKTQYWAKMFWDKLKTKSPFFRAWFGDWREYDTKEFEPLGTVRLIDAKDKHEAEQYIKDGIKHKTLFRGDVKNADTDFVINVGVQVYNDTLAYLNRRYSRNKKFDEYIAKLSLLNEIEKITQNAILLNSFVADSEKNPYQSFFHKFYTIANVGKNDYLVRLTVDELNSTDEPIRRAYNINGIKITPIAGIQVYKPAYTMGDSGDSISTISISKLFDIVKQNDEEFNPNLVNPAFLNDDGTPKVFYHGTNAKWTEYDLSKNVNQMWGEGIYLTPNYNRAKLYGEIVMPFYVRALVNNRTAKTTGEKKDHTVMKNGDVLVYSPEQIKSATDNIGTFDKENADIRYSKQITQQTEDNIEQLALENEAVETLIDEARDNIPKLQSRLKWAKDMQVPSNKFFANSKVLQEVVSKHNYKHYKYTETEIFEHLEKIVNDENSGTLMSSLTRLMGELLRSSDTYSRDLYDKYKEFRDTFKSASLVVSQDAYNDLVETYGSKKALRNATFGKINIMPSKKIDSAENALVRQYEKLSVKFPELLPEVDNEAEMVEAVMAAARAIRPTVSYVSDVLGMTVEADVNEVAVIAASDLLAELTESPSEITAFGKQLLKTEKSANSYKKRMEKAREN